MKTRTLLFPSVSKNEVIARQYLDQKPVLNFQLNGHQGQLRIVATQKPEQSMAEFVYFNSQLGPLGIYNAEPLLNLLSLCPLLPENMHHPAADWYWDLYNTALSDEIKNMFGYLQPTQKHIRQAIYCGVEISINGQCAKGGIALSSATLMRFFPHPAWLFIRAVKMDGFVLSIPLILASTELDAATLQRLRVGDIVLPETPFFNPAGAGRLRVGNHWFYLRQRASLALCFTIVSHKEMEMDITPVDTTTPHPDAGIAPVSLSREDPEYVHEMPDLSAIPLRLTLRAGTLTLPLEQLQSLQAGSILTFDDFTPGHAAIYYGERPLAQGELVDVEGVLGLKITRMEHF